MKRYPSKISYGLLLFVIAVIVGTTIPIISQGNLLGLGINLLTLLFVLYVFFSIYYTIEGNILIISIGFVTMKKIDISKIMMISKSNSWISSPAASLDRLKISYNKHSNILVSPRDKEGFIKELTRINSKIAVQKM